MTWQPDSADELGSERSNPCDVMIRRQWRYARQKHERDVIPEEVFASLAYMQKASPEYQSRLSLDPLWILLAHPELLFLSLRGLIFIFPLPSVWIICFQLEILLFFQIGFIPTSLIYPPNNWTSESIFFKFSTY